MSGESLLGTIAEVAATFAGFSGLIAIFAASRADGPRLAHFPQLWIMLESALSTLFLALLPPLLHEMDVPRRGGRPGLPLAKLPRHPGR